MEESKENYNTEKVVYCKSCLSLAIISDNTIPLDYCDKCGSTDLAETDINTWESMYQKRYGENYIKRRHNGR